MIIDIFNNIQKPVFFDNDGSADDFLALITLLTFDNYRITGIALSEGNCYIDSSEITILKLLDLFCRHDIILAKSSSTATYPFPESWREKSRQVASLSSLSNLTANHAKVSKNDAVDFLAQKLLEETEKTTIIVTGPATNLSAAIQKYPEITEKIERVLWQAGAFLVDGDVVAPDVDGSAEWNIFWDPISAQNLLKSEVQISIFPLDICNQLPVDNYLLHNLSANTNSKLSHICFQLTDYLELQNKKKYFRGLLPVIYLKFPELFQFENTSINIEQRGTSLGNIFRSSLGSRIKYAKRVDDESFFEIFNEQVSQF